MKVKIAVLCFVILCTWYVYSVHNRYCPPMHNLYLLLCSDHGNIYEKNPLSMMIVQRRESQVWYSGSLLCEDSSFSHLYVCCIHSGTKSADVLQKSVLEYLAADNGKKLPVLARCYMPKGTIARKKIVTCASSPLIQSGFIATFIKLTLCEDVRVCSQIVEMQIHVPFYWLL